MIAGESAGGNLTLALTLATLTRGSEGWCRRIFERAWTPMAILPACPLAQVSNSNRYRGKMNWLYLNRVRFLSESYLAGGSALHLADPLLYLESDEPLERPFPPTLLTVGGQDPIKEDSDRLAEALKGRGIDAFYKIYPKGHHAFYASLWGKSAAQCWLDYAQFLQQCSTASRKSFPP